MSVHLLIESCIGCNFKRMIVVEDIGKVAARAQLCSDPINLLCFFAVSHGFFLPFRSTILLFRLFFPLFFSVKIALFLISKPSQSRIDSRSACLMRLQCFKNLTGSCDRPMKALPNFLWLVHERVFFGDLYTWHNIQSVNNVIISICKLEK